MNTEQLRTAIKKLPSLPSSKRFTWTFNRQCLRDNIMNDDPEKFLTWPTIQGTMFVGNAPYIEKEADALEGHFSLEVFLDDGFGKPELWIAFTDGTEEKKLTGDGISGNFIHQAYHLMNWETVTKEKVKSLNTIVEFGGGYGAMCLICRRLGFKGDYIIVDFPEFNLLQGYYLSNTVGIDNTYFIRSGNGFPVQSDLLIANYSLSEASIETRDGFISTLGTDHHLIAYQPVWDGIDNIEYFNSRFQLGKKISIEHLGHWYSVY